MSTESFYKAIDKSFKKLVELFIPLVLDPEIFEQQPKILLQNGDFKRCNILIGTNTIEAYEFIDEKLINKHLLKEKLAENPGRLVFDLQKYYFRYGLKSKEDFIEKIFELYGLNSKENEMNFQQVKNVRI